MRLNFLQNHPLNTNSNQILISSKYPNISPIDPKESTQLQKDSKNFAEKFGGDKAHSFGFLCGDWLEFFLKLYPSYKIAYAIGNHQQSYQAFKMLNFKAIPIAPDKKNAQIQIKSVTKAIQNQCDCFIIPFINEDILTFNPIEKIKEELSKSLKKFLLIIDVSAALSLNITLPKILDAQTLFLINGESLGILRGNGAIITKDFKQPQILPQSLLNPKLFEAFLNAMHSPIQKQENTKNKFYQYLQIELKNHINLFSPLKNTPPNCLALRFSSIKVRNLLQSLLLQKIHAINGAQCLYGLSMPSFVLQEMGYSEMDSRELLSISYNTTIKDDTLIKLSKAISYSYKQIRQLEV
ncbi:hypothetical protein [Helicobacter sp. 13S00477-4]|uniref:hypothetical protein n=1 Tax=Helicobacter sp. 13S00477-4 TaxID=1905759 RepID=UPI000BA50636|nr:hypothetical protein [Helicobacter sp. 13S00477-4]PAF51950.1 hypothetical protein BKH44_04625 [Helicobacter sp. 13S00477-4]